MKKKIISAVLGALILFIWNAISWMALPFHGQSLKSIPEGAIDMELLRSTLEEDGIYHYPGLDAEDMAAKLATGPRIPFMVYKQGPTSAFDPMSFLGNLLLNLLSATVIILVLSKVTKGSKSDIIMACLLMGVLVGVTSDLPQMNWYMHPFSYAATNIMDHIIGFGLLGLFLANYTFKPSNA